MKRLSFSTRLEFYKWDFWFGWNLEPGKIMYRLEEHFRREKDKTFTAYYFTFNIGAIGLP